MEEEPIIAINESQGGVYVLDEENNSVYVGETGSSGGHFYASPSDVTWGSSNNPDLFVKIWFDVSGRVDVNFSMFLCPISRSIPIFPMTAFMTKREQPLWIIDT